MKYRTKLKIVNWVHRLLGVSLYAPRHTVIQLEKQIQVLDWQFSIPNHEYELYVENDHIKEMVNLELVNQLNKLNAIDIKDTKMRDHHEIRARVYFIEPPPKR